MFDQMKIFITGGSGLIGQYLNSELSKKHNILTQYNINKGNCGNYLNLQSEITDYKKIENVFAEFKPDCVIHSAAISNPEKADALEPSAVYEINVNATLKLAELCRKYGAKLIYLSTDMVYAGYRGTLLKEDAKLIPISLYAETKLMGEIKIKETFDNYLILRTALQFGFGMNHSRNNFHNSFIALKNQEPVKLFADQFRSPLSILESARIIGELAEKNIRKEIVNFGGSEKLNRYEMIEILCEEAGLDKNLLVKINMNDSDLRYKVADVSMNIEKLNSLGIRVKSYRDSVKEILSEVNI